MSIEKKNLSAEEELELIHTEIESCIPSLNYYEIRNNPDAKTLLESEKEVAILRSKLWKLRNRRTELLDSQPLVYS